MFFGFPNIQSRSGSHKVEKISEFRKFWNLPIPPGSRFVLTKRLEDFVKEGWNDMSSFSKRVKSKCCCKNYSMDWIFSGMVHHVSSFITINLLESLDVVGFQKD